MSLSSCVLFLSLSLLRLSILLGVLGNTMQLGSPTPVASRLAVPLLWSGNRTCEITLPRTWRDEVAGLTWNGTISAFCISACFQSFLVSARLSHPDGVLAFHNSPTTPAQRSILQRAPCACSLHRRTPAVCTVSCVRRCNALWMIVPLVPLKVDDVSHNNLHKWPSSPIRSGAFLRFWIAMQRPVLQYPSTLVYKHLLGEFELASNRGLCWDQVVGVFFDEFLDTEQGLLSSCRSFRLSRAQQCRP